MYAAYAGSSISIDSAGWSRTVTGSRPAGRAPATPNMPLSSSGTITIAMRVPLPGCVPVSSIVGPSIVEKVGLTPACAKIMATAPSTGSPSAS